MAKKYINTMVVRDNTELNGVELIFAEKPTEAVRNAIKGKEIEGDNIHGKKQYKGLAFQWNDRKALWWDYNSKALKKDLDELIEVLKELGYKVKDERKVTPTRAKRPNTTTTTTRRRGGRRTTTTTTKAPTPVVEATPTPAVEATTQSAGFTKYDVQMEALRLLRDIVEMNR